MREQRKYSQDNSNKPKIKLKEIVLVEEEPQLQLSWQIATVEELIERSDENVKGALLRILISSHALECPGDKLCKAESIYCNGNKFISV